MKRIPWLLTVLIATALGFVALKQAHLKSTLTEANIDLARRLNDLEEENQRLSNILAQTDDSRSNSNAQLRELLRLRAEVARLRQESNAAFSLREQNRSLRGTLGSQGAPNLDGSSGFWPKESWTFAGYATPEATFQSMLWFANRGDVTNLLACSTPEYRLRTEADLLKNGEAAAVTEITNEMAKLNSCRLLERTVISDNEIQLKLWMDGEHTETNSMSFVRVANEWKLAKP